MRSQQTTKTGNGMKAFLLIACLDLCILGGGAFAAHFAEDGAASGIHLAKSCLNGACANEADRSITVAQRLPGSSRPDGRQ